MPAPAATPAQDPARSPAPTADALPVASASPDPAPVATAANPVPARTPAPAVVAANVPAPPATSTPAPVQIAAASPSVLPSRAQPRALVPLSRESPAFPREALAAGVDKGVVRARVRIGTAAPVVAPDLARVALPVRLGLLTRLHDGLMGYFVDDDYSRFYPVHEVLAKQTRSGGRHEGFHAAAHAVSGFYDAFPAKPVDHPYLDASPTLRLRIGQTARLTLLLDPRGGVDATSGVLPTKKIELMREHVSKALDAIALTFRVGPVLSDPTTIRMPLPKEIRGQWSWVRRTGVTVWNEAPVVHASQDAMISKTPSELMEGWLRLTKAFAGQEP